MTTPNASTIAWTVALALHMGLLLWPVDRESSPTSRRVRFVEFQAAVLPEVAEPLPVPEPVVPEPDPVPEPMPEPVVAKPRAKPAEPKPAEPKPAEPKPAESPPPPSEALPPTGETPGLPALPSPTDSTAQVFAAATPTATRSEPTAPSPRTARNSERGTSSPAQANGNAEHDLRNYGRSIHRAVVAQRHYPLPARRLKLTGQVKVRITIDRHGRLVGQPELVASSGHTVLDDEAIAAVRRSAPFPGLPATTPGAHAKFVIPIAFHLSDERHP